MMNEELWDEVYRLKQMVRELRQEVNALRNEVKDLQRARFGAELEAETTRRAREFDARHAGRDR
jgi:regulator of replication initiation timing